MHAIDHRFLQAIEPQIPDPGEAWLLADCGQPRWPFWQLVVALLLALQAVIVAQAALGNEAPDMNRLTRPATSRVFRPGPGARAGGARLRLVQGGRKQAA